MHNLVLLLMGVVIFISLKNNKNILLKNIFIQKDVDLNSKKQYGVVTFPFWMKSLYSRSALSSLQGHPAFSKEASSCSWLSPGWKSFTGAGTERTVARFSAVPMVWSACVL